MFEMGEQVTHYCAASLAVTAHWQLEHAQAGTRTIEKPECLSSSPMTALKKVSWRAHLFAQALDATSCEVISHNGAGGSAAQTAGRSAGHPKGVDVQKLHLQPTDYKLARHLSSRFLCLRVLPAQW